MYNRVILAEKPDMGENIAKALGIASKNVATLYYRMVMW